MAKEEKKRLTPLETLVMDAIWDKPDTSVRDVQETLVQAKPMAYNTVLTVMRILRDKGFLSSRRQGRMDLYSATVEREQVARRSVRDVLDGFFSGSSAALVSELLDSDELSDDDLKAIREKTDGLLKDRFGYGQTEAKVFDYFKSEASDSGDLPVLGITMGDVCGVGPEIIAKAFDLEDLYILCRPLVIGDVYAMENACKTVGAKLKIKAIDSPLNAEFEPGIVEVINPLFLESDSWEKGHVSLDAGRAAAEWVIEAVKLAMAEEIDGIVTAPLNKEAMNLAGYTYPGHTELLAEQAGGHDVRLMLASPRMSVVHVTGHMALHEVSECLTQKRVYDTIAMTHDALVKLGKTTPRLAVTGLNPHAGENGLFGEEDGLVIRPAVEQGRDQGWEIDGPLPADATYFKAYDGQYDGVVAMYHDQGHAPMKLVAFDTAVNVTLGLPIIRTSVDHGTAFDIAGTGVAKEQNLIYAVGVGAKLAIGRKNALAES
ncbi:MAG: 4-hydroxythreonine-4-phosphate dehydrogenase PdxA [Candidatus Latescibacterota bacterium]|nr:4-hydroxythreonine-4-phosphate dehydrogenase PdxA [Candidatus Latescibacterota bacterium]